ncbi:DUF2897 family protein [Rheinheimera pleomorphica]|uniref:DUF2897 family protein n=1 Tax=Rheinheimera pleomorphica TaxID=2703963 RepID=UPI001423C46B
MNWPLFWALTLAFGVIIGNIMLLKHAAKFKLPPLKPKDKTHNGDNTTSDSTKASSQTSVQRGQTPNSPE